MALRYLKENVSWTVTTTKLDDYDYELRHLEKAG
jgi:hypothetical protein